MSWMENLSAQHVIYNPRGNRLTGGLLQAAPAGDAVDFYHIGYAVFRRHKIHARIIQLKQTHCAVRPELPFPSLNAMGSTFAPLE